MNGLDFLVQAQLPQVEFQDWMADREMILGTVDNIEQAIQECIDAGLYGLDLETTGVDNRVFRGKTVDHIVGVGMAPSIKKGYYIPLAHEKGSQHNIPMSIFRPLFQKLLRSGSRPIFHNGKFDMEFLEHNGGEPFGDFDDYDIWEDTFVLAHLFNSRMKRKGLKAISKEFLNQEMIVLADLFPRGHKGKLDFSQLDPGWDPVLWYGASDVICTLQMYHFFLPEVIEVKKFNQKTIYKVEKACITATRWMERNRIPVNLDTVKELIILGQTEYVESIKEVYQSIEQILDRQATPNSYKLLFEHAEVDNIEVNLIDQIKKYKTKSLRTLPDTTETILKKNKKYPYVYDIRSAQQLGSLFEELEVPGLSYTEKSGQVATGKEELDRYVESNSEAFGFMAKIKRFREINTALSTFLYPLWKDTDRTDGTIRIEFHGLKTDTGRFSTPGSKEDTEESGGTTLNLQATPSAYDENRPICMQRIRECFCAPPGTYFICVDYSGEELRVVTNLSQEPKWLDAFYACSDCEKTYPKDDKPPQFCTCGSDKIGDVHSLSAYSFYGRDARKSKDFKKLRGDAKKSNFALCYGGGGNAVKNSIHCSDEEGSRIKRLFDATYTYLARWWKKQHEFGRKNGYVRTAFGRRYPVPDITHEKGFFRSKAERNATNGPVQGTSADIIKIAMHFVYKECKARGWLDKVRMVITMHDELDFVIDSDVMEEAIEVIQEIMTNNAPLQKLQWKIPLVVDIEMGHSWAVPWSYHKMKRKGTWVEELIPFFPRSIQDNPVQRTDQTETVQENTKPTIVSTKPSQDKIIFPLQKLDEKTIKIIKYILRESYEEGGRPIAFQYKGREYDFGFPVQEEKCREIIKELL